MSALLQAIAPNPHTNLLNLYIQIANKMGFQQQKIILLHPVAHHLLANVTGFNLLTFITSICNTL
jgi:hypothetical protein